MRANRSGVAWIGGDASPYGGGPEIHLAEESGQRFVGRQVVCERHGKALELLPKRHGNSILQLGPAHFDDMAQFLALGSQRFGQAPQLRHQLAISQGKRDMKG